MLLNVGCQSKLKLRLVGGRGSKREVKMNGTVSIIRMALMESDLSATWGTSY